MYRSYVVPFFIRIFESVLFTYGTKYSWMDVVEVMPNLSSFMDLLLESYKYDKIVWPLSDTFVKKNKVRSSARFRRFLISKNWKQKIQQEQRSYTLKEKNPRTKSLIIWLFKTSNTESSTTQITMIFCHFIHSFL